MGVVLSAASSYKNIPVSKKIIAIGEVGLTGEVRNVNLIEKRIKEAEKMGFTTCIIPESNKKYIKNEFKIKVIGVKNINEAMKAAGLK